MSMETFHRCRDCGNLVLDYSLCPRCESGSDECGEAAEAEMEATYTDNSVRHDDCSQFDADGFAINEDGTRRNWVPLWSDGREPVRGRA